VPITANTPSDTNHDSPLVEGNAYTIPEIAAEISQADGCADCEKLKKEKKKLQRQVRTLKCKVDDLNQKLTLNQSEWAKTFHKLNQSPVKSKQPAGETMS